jgi:hypothetical protein
MGNGKSLTQRKLEGIQAKAVLDIVKRFATPHPDPKTPLEVIQNLMASGQHAEGHAMIAQEMEKEARIIGYGYDVTTWARMKGRKAVARRQYMVLRERLRSTNEVAKLAAE